MADLKVTSLFKTQTGFNLTRYVIMLALKKQGTLTQSVIQRQLKIDNAAVTRHLKSLETQGYVVRRRNPQNNREIVVSLTNGTRQALAHCGETAADQTLLTAFSQQFSPQQVAQLADLLKQLNQLTLS
ncbi:MarR family transcriptional regulator [Lactiplantibacillus plantarum]